MVVSFEGARKTWLGVTVLVEMAAGMTATCEHMQRITSKQRPVCIEPYVLIETLTRLKFCEPRSMSHPLHLKADERKWVDSDRD